METNVVSSCSQSAHTISSTKPNIQTQQPVACVFREEQSLIKSPPECLVQAHHDPPGSLDSTRECFRQTQPQAVMQRKSKRTDLRSGQTSTPRPACIRECVASSRPPSSSALPATVSTQFCYPHVTSVYGHVHVYQNSTVVIHTSAPIPPDTTVIYLVPPVHPQISTPTTVATEDTCSSVDSAQPVTILIERNSFKQWLDQNIPESILQFPRLKRYKSVETFMHWITAKKKHLDLPLTILIRVTEVRNLLSELGKEFPQSIITQKILRNIFAYEHLFNLTTHTPTTTTSRSSKSNEDSINISHCLEDACRTAIASMRDN